MPSAVAMAVRLVRRSRWVFWGTTFAHLQFHTAHWRSDCCIADVPQPALAPGHALGTTGNQKLPQLNNMTHNTTEGMLR